MRKIAVTLGLILAVQIAAMAMSERTISGKIRDSFSQPLQGVSVTADKSLRGTLSDSAGEFKLKVTTDDKWLTFSFVGMKTLREKIGEKTVLNITMVENVLQINENMMVGYAKERKMDGVYGAAPHSSIRIGGIFALPVQETEAYAEIGENNFKSALKNPLSTFSIDVDNASYSNVRRFLNQGILPPVDAVKVEEMINYFHYNYPEPKGEHPFSVTTELGRCPWKEDHYLLHVGLKAKSIDKQKLPASNLVFLIDVSGSMNQPNKLPLVKQAFKMLVNELRPQDKVAIIVYAGAAGQVLESTPGTKKDKIFTAIENLEAGGSTAGGAGLKLAYEIASENFIKEGNNRIILATDGDFNVGVSSNSEMEKMVEKERKSGVFMTVLGFGMGNIKDDKMEIIADKGNGNYSYIDNIQEARKVFISEFGGTLFTIAKDVKFQVEFNPAHVKSYRLVGYENRLLNEQDFNNDAKDAGEMGSGHTVTALYEIIPSSSKDDYNSVDPLKYQKNDVPKTMKNGELLTIKIRYKATDGDSSILLDKIVEDKPVANTSDDFRFSAAVASFGMVLRNSDYRGNSNFKSIIKMAKEAKGIDDEGYRAEFINLVKSADDLKLIDFEKE